MKPRTPALVLGAALLVGFAIWQFAGRAPWAREPAQAFSPLAYRLLDEGGPWQHVQGRHVLLHAPAAERELAALARAADFAYRDIGKRLALEEATGQPPVHIFILRDAGRWREDVLAAGLRPDGLALRMGSEAFLLLEPGHPQERTVLPHEMAHLRLGRAFGAALPLWLEEGLAQYLAWETAMAFQAGQGGRLDRTLPPVPPSELLPEAAVVRAEAYPTDERQARIFYRQAEEMVRAIAQTVGRHDLRLFLDRFIEEPGDWRDVLRHHFRCTEADLEAIEKRVNRRVTEGEVD